MRRFPVRAIAVTALATAALPFAGAAPASAALSPPTGSAPAVVSSLPAAAEGEHRDRSFRDEASCTRYGNSQNRYSRDRWFCRSEGGNWWFYWRD